MPFGDALVGHRSRAMIPPLVLDRPRSLAEAARILAGEGPAAVPIAGGIDVVSRLKRGHPAALRRLVALRGVPELHAIRREAGGLLVGAAVTHDALMRAMRQDWPALAAYLEGLGNIRIRVQGTLGGNLLAGEHAYEALPLLLALGATALVLDVATLRETEQAVGMPVAGLLTAIRLPARPPTLLWDRSLRPAVTVVAARGEGTRAVLAGAGFPAMAAEVTGDAAGWAAALPAFTTSAGPDAGWCRQVGGVLLRRMLAR